MEQPRYVQTGNYSFLGDFVYDQVVSQDHFLRKLKEMVNWKRYSYRVIKLYKGEGVVGDHPLTRRRCCGCY